MGTVKAKTKNNFTLFAEESKQFAGDAYYKFFLDIWRHSSKIKKNLRFLREKLGKNVTKSLL